jgi:biotin operon repressor
MAIQYTDILTYIAVRSYLNNKTQACFPSYESISKKMGASKKFVMQSINRLLACNLINVFKSSKARVSNRYAFKELETFDRIPPELLELKDLSVHEKAMLLLLRQCCISRSMEISNSYKELSQVLGLSYKAIYTQVESLIAKGYVIEKKRIRTTSVKSWQLSNLIDWHYDDTKEEKEVEHLNLIFV